MAAGKLIETTLGGVRMKGLATTRSLDVGDCVSKYPGRLRFKRDADANSLYTADVYSEYVIDGDAVVESINHFVREHGRYPPKLEAYDFKAYDLKPVEFSKALGIFANHSCFPNAMLYHPPSGTMDGPDAETSMCVVALRDLDEDVQVFVDYGEQYEKGWLDAAQQERVAVALAILADCAGSTNSGAIATSRASKTRYRDTHYVKYRNGDEKRVTIFYPKQGGQRVALDVMAGADVFEANEGNEGCFRVLDGSTVQVTLTQYSMPVAVVEVKSGGFVDLV